jgi:hypothetical protein
MLKFIITKKKKLQEKKMNKNFLQIIEHFMQEQIFCQKTIADLTK